MNHVDGNARPDFEGRHGDAPLINPAKALPVVDPPEASSQSISVTQAVPAMTQPSTPVSDSVAVASTASQPVFKYGLPIKSEVPSSSRQAPNSELASGPEPILFSELASNFQPEVNLLPPAPAPTPINSTASYNLDFANISLTWQRRDANCFVCFGRAEVSRPQHDKAWVAMVPLLYEDSASPGWGLMLDEWATKIREFRTAQEAMAQAERYLAVFHYIQQLIAQTNFEQVAQTDLDLATDDQPRPGAQSNSI